MIARYTRPEMGRIWSEDNKYACWLEVELAASESLAELGVVPGESAQLLRRHAAFDTARIQTIEAKVKHDVIAFTTAVSEKLADAGAAEASRWFHYGLTSNDVVDTAQALQVKSLRPLFQMNLVDVLKPLFDVTADGQRILAVTPARAESSSIGLLLNWPALLSK